MGTDIVILKPQPPTVVAELSPIVNMAKSFEVVDQATNALALERLRALRAGEKRITECFEPSRKAADEAKKEILRLRDGLIGPIAEARGIYDHKAAAYEAAERQRAEEASRRLQEAARKAEEERTLMDAINAEAEGDSAAAEAILAEPISAPIVTVAPQVAKVEGVSNQTRWSAEVDDLMKLVRYVAANPQWVSLLEANMPNLNRLAISQHEALSIPGVRAVKTTVRSMR